MLNKNVEALLQMALEYDTLKSQAQQTVQPIVYSGDEIPICQKPFLSLKEAAKYTGVGINKLREISNENPSLTLFIGTKRLLKRELLDEYLKKMYSI